MSVSLPDTPLSVYLSLFHMLYHNSNLPLHCQFSRPLADSEEKMAKIDELLRKAVACGNLIDKTKISVGADDKCDVGDEGTVLLCTNHETTPHASLYGTRMLPPTRTRQATTRRQWTTSCCYRR